MNNIRHQIQQILDGDYNTREKVKINGEVFTPFFLIEEMLNQLPNHLWKDPTKTWLDPAAGLGNFHCVVLERLMVGLSDFISDEQLRYKHIIENQLYFIELNPRSAVWIRRLFNPNRQYHMNLVCADALDPDHPGWDKVGYMWDDNDKGYRLTRRAIKKSKDDRQKLAAEKLKYLNPTSYVGEQ